jgi:glycosyltransferase involved in cell wall biosynthesis
LFDPLELSLMGEDWKAKVSWNRYAAQQASSMRRSQAVIFPSEHAQKVVSKSLGGHIPSVVVPHGVDNSYFEVPMCNKMDNQSISILYVSTILSSKHQDAVVTAIADLRRRLQKDIRLTLVGSTEVDHTATSRLSQTIHQEHAEQFTTVLGEVSHDQVLSMMSATDIFVFASSCEVFGIALLEAMAAGLPIACSNKSGLPGLLRDGGVYFDPFDSASIAAAVEKLVLDSGLRNDLSRRAREIARSYSWKESACATYAVLMHASIGPRRVIPDE